MNKSHIAFELDIDPSLIAHQSVRTASQVVGGAAVTRYYQPQKKVRLKQQLKMLIRQAVKGKVDLNAQADACVYITKLEYRFAPPKSMPKHKLKLIEEGKVLPKNTKPDLGDNLNKLLFDAMSKVVYFDDSRIVSMANVSKCYAKKSGISVELTIEWE